MDVFRGKWLLALGLVLCLSAGCEKWSGSISLGKQEAESEDAGLELDEDLAITDDETTALEAEVASGENIEPASHAESGTPPSPQGFSSAPAERLALNLKVGERFPLSKGVTQTVFQSTPEGDRRSQSKLDIMIVLTVKERPEGGPHAGQYLFDVKYHRVKYEQDLLGKKLRYNSELPGEPTPPELLTYSRLAGNGFAFWLKGDNQIGELVGFEDFLKHCLDGLPEANIAQARNLIAGTTGTEGLANFVDDSVGLLPPTAIRMGDTWSMDRQVLQPIAMKIASRYSLTSLDELTAEISILGQVSPIASVSSDAQNRPLNVVVEGGQLFGSCTIDRRSGLPVHSQVNQEISMRVKLADKPEFRQRKQSITTIRAFPIQANSSPIVGSAPQTSHVTPGMNPALDPPAAILPGQSAQAGAIQQTSATQIPGQAGEVGIRQAGGLEAAPNPATIRQADFEAENSATPQ